MSALATILIGAAANVGAPIVKGILAKHFGGTASEIGGAVVNAIAEKAGVTVEALADAPQDQIEAAVQSVESEAPELINALVTAQQQGNQLMMAEMEKQSGFGWLWRPAGMWLMLGCIGFYILLLPILGLVVGHPVQLTVGFSDFVTVFVTYTSLYMGGNTAIRVLKRG